MAGYGPDRRAGSRVVAKKDNPFFKRAESRELTYSLEPNLWEVHHPHALHPALTPVYEAFERIWQADGSADPRTWNRGGRNSAAFGRPNYYSHDDGQVLHCTDCAPAIFWQRGQDDFLSLSSTHREAPGRFEVKPGEHSITFSSTVCGEEALHLAAAAGREPAQVHALFRSDQAYVRFWFFGRLHRDKTIITGGSVSVIYPQLEYKWGSKKATRFTVESGNFGWRFAQGGPEYAFAPRVFPSGRITLPNLDMQLPQPWEHRGGEWLASHVKLPGRQIVRAFLPELRADAHD